MNHTLDLPATQDAIVLLVANFESVASLGFFRDSLSGSCQAERALKAPSSDAKEGLEVVRLYKSTMTRWWFQTFFMFTPFWGRFLF